MLPIGSRRRAPFSINQLTKVYFKGEFSDFTLILSDGELKVHRIILASASEYFASVFNSGFKESHTNSIVIKDNPKIFKVLIDHIYGTPLPELTLLEQLEMFQMIKFYRIHLLMDQAGIYLSELKVLPKEFSTYVSMIEMIYEELTPTMMGLTAKKVVQDTDLSEFSDEFLEELFSHEVFSKKFLDEIEIFWMIHGLVKSGHSSKLYRFVKFRNIDKGILEILKASEDVTDDMLSCSSLRMPLTVDLVKRLQDEEKKALVVRVHSILDRHRCGVTGDGDQTEIILSSPIHLYVEIGDIIKIQNYIIRGNIISVSEFTHVR